VTERTQSLREVFALPWTEGQPRGTVTASTSAAALAQGLLLTRRELAEIEARERRVSEAEPNFVQLARLSGFSGVQVLSGGASLVVSLKRGTPSEDFEGVLAQSPFAGDFALKYVRHSLHDLLAAQRLASPSLRAEVWYGLSVDIERNGLTFWTEKSPAHVQPPPVNVNVPVELRFNQQNVEDGCPLNRENCNSPQRAGVRVDDGTTRYCSTGFPVSRRSNGDQMVLTAGHCWYGHDYDYLQSGTEGLFGYLEPGTALYHGGSSNLRGKLT
jgi:hypothetical protein